MTGQALVVQGDALHLPLPDESVDLCISSPPYWALRAYGAGPGEIGSEPTPQLFLEALWAATAEMMRVLKPTGSMFVDLGDKYAAAQGGRQSAIGELPKKVVHRDAQPRQRPDLPNPPASWGTRDATTTHISPEQAPPKSLLLLPERYRVGCVDRLGLIARAVLIWQKPNGLPESVRDRVKRDHEDWVHLVKQPRYYSATDEIREPHTEVWRSTGRVENRGTKSVDGGANNGCGLSGETPREYNPLGKLPGSVWTIPSEPLRLPEHLGVQHYAAFPSEWPRRLILGWSPPGICLECGTGRVPVVDKGGPDPELLAKRGYTRNRWSEEGPRGHINRWNISGKEGQETNIPATILGYACACTPFTDHPGTGEPSGAHGVTGLDPRAQDTRYPGGFTDGAHSSSYANRPKVGPWREWHLDRWEAPPTRPSVVFDPFTGTGTTIGVARQLGRIGIGVDLSHSYCRAARYRVFQSGDFGKAEARSWRDRQGSLL